MWFVWSIILIRIFQGAIYKNIWFFSLADDSGRWRLVLQSQRVFDKLGMRLKNQPFSQTGHFKCQSKCLGEHPQYHMELFYIISASLCAASHSFLMTDFQRRLQSTAINDSQLFSRTKTEHEGGGEVFIFPTVENVIQCHNQEKLSGLHGPSLSPPEEDWVQALLVFRSLPRVPSYIACPNGSELCWQSKCC